MIEKKVIIAFGGNQGETYDIFVTARELLHKSLGTIVASAKIYESKAMLLPNTDYNATDKNPHLNTVVSFLTTLSAIEVLASCLEIEKQMGRFRSKDKRWGGRTIDLDIVDYVSEIITSSALTLPHAGMTQRDFVLLPLFDISPEFIHPVTGVHIKTMIKELPEGFITGIYQERW